jgi:hypothetical protein
MMTNLSLWKGNFITYIYIYIVGNKFCVTVVNWPWLNKYKDTDLEKQMFVREMHTKFWSENVKGGEHLEVLGVCGMDFREIRWEGVDWIHLA